MCPPMSFKKFLKKPFIIRLLHWEYWNSNIVYALIYPVITLYCILSGFRYFFAASNPRIKNGGFLMESKKDIYPLLPKNYTPKTIFLEEGVLLKEVIELLQKNTFQYPIIIKPNIGLKGYAVKKIDTEHELNKFIQFYSLDFHIQEFVPYTKEIGLFYYRFPDRENGQLSGIVSKEFLTITGDGNSTMLELLFQDDRNIIQLESLKKEFAEKINDIIPDQKRIVLVPYGNHVRGSKFLDASHLIDETLTNSFDSICKQIPDFYFGRLDIRYANWEDLRHGKNFSIIELNGAGSEPTHIYDPKHSVFFAWYEIVRHWTILWRISRINHKKGYPYLSISEGTKMFMDNEEHTKKLKKIHEVILLNS